MTASELIERLTAIVKEQAEIIRIQSEALALLGSVDGLNERICEVALEQNNVIGD